MSTTKEISIGDIGSRGAEASTKLDGDKMALNVGPSHPTTHGVLRLIMELDGDLIEKCEPVLGYLHRGDEKIAENMTYNQFVPYTDRLDYLAPLANNVAYAIAVEKLTGRELYLSPRLSNSRRIRNSNGARSPFMSASKMPKLQSGSSWYSCAAQRAIALNSCCRSA